MREQSVAWEDRQLAVLVSGGVATLLWGSALTPNELIERADDALYAAKRRGRVLSRKGRAPG
ncbi:diguanylate cyclase [Methyloterricola oryzae]|uniref:diguanylate cyclase n=1 Tax=Methyloterricola oryzae TaxID=1495050 RepID=UPI0019102066|nr:diguanylate cyclase [Methyloterricola oryzae]